jgi:hypothetical protein
MHTSFAAALLLIATSLPQAGELKPNEVEGLAKKLTEYIEARSENKGLDKVQEAVAKELEKIEKRIKRDPLSLPAEIGQALWQALEYDKKGSLPKGKVATQKLAAYWDAKAEFEYAYWVPARYDPRKPYPLLLCIPDQGERPTDHLTERWADADLRNGAILVAIPMPADAGIWVEGINPTKETGMGNVGFTFAQVLRRLAVDYDRIVLAGHGRGVEVCAAYGSTFPDRFAGLVGRTGDVGDVAAENLANLPSFFAGAGGRATELKDKTKALGHDNVTLMPEGKAPEVWAWVQGHARASNPSSVQLKIGSPVPNRAYWLETRPTDGQGTAWLKGAIDRASNTITVEGEGVSRFSIHFNDALVDLDKPIKVVCNGTLNERTVPRSLQRALDLFASSRSDPGKLYVNSVEFDLPPKPKEKEAGR